MWLIAVHACTDDLPTGSDTAASTEPPPEALEPPLGTDVLPFPACVPGASDGRLDLEDACADGICIGQTFDDASSAYGEAPYCLSLVPGATACFYGGFILAGYTDADGDMLPDDGKRAYTVQVFAGWPGGSEQGLSVGISPACWVDALGVADHVLLGAQEDGLYAVSMTWDLYYLTVHDQQDASYAFIPDGVVEQFVFSNGVYGP
jgi:hypothetical protein